MGRLGDYRPTKLQRLGDWCARHNEDAVWILLTLAIFALPIYVVICAVFGCGEVSHAVCH